MTTLLTRNNDAQKKIATILVTNLYEQTKVGLLASLLCATVVFICLLMNKPNTILYIWYFYFLVILAARLILVNAFLSSSKTDIYLKQWRNVFILSAFLGGISWGLTGTPLLMPAHGIYQTVVMIILAGISAGSVPLLAPVPAAAVAFLVPALLPMIFQFLLLKDHLDIFLGVTIAIYLIYLCTLAFRSHQVIKKSITLQFENETLVKDLSEAKNRLESANVRLKQDALHDPLTHVANRNLFMNILREAIDKAAHENKIVALLYLDLDGFKGINDRYGHHAGDQLLLIIVSRLKNTLREHDTISRLGGDELTVILQNIGTVEAVADVAERIRKVIAEPVKLSNSAGETHVQVYASIGISLFPLDGQDVNTLVEIADKAMYHVKGNGGNHYHFNSSDIRT